MSTAARKARKSAGIPYVKPRKAPTRPYGPSEGFGMVKPAELLAALLVRGTR